ncbi:nose resistant to fluoxetine protein 6-like [Drosophila obscura]|uniref:nose resistant to fluoxetine protein 6-like n=1 Tax=Drosophila obscura TaxID=7282 RepID=UPI001BB2C5E7|nr:nose resistant to fluoxetine protein 6-like [Drosophila obscura]XP_041449514.1 nose resistant to fluoxetine protein 6-like [Drosophila obscura]XP_041449515.1 nose resistant to fluoxetine protein 6-like [Drosophila obscura]
MVNVLGTLFVCGLVLVGAAKLRDGNFPPDYERLKGLRSLGAEFAGHFRNESLTELDLFNSRIPSQEDLLCLADMAQFMQALTGGKLWALKMIDAWGSIPSGLLYGNVMDLGNFDECVKISKEITSSHSINGKYCFINVPIASNALQIGSCFPASCSAAHMDAFLGQLVQKLFNVSSLSMNIKEATCQTSESKPWDGMTIFTVVLLGLMGSIVALCTLYDYFCSQDQSEGLPTVVKIFSARASSRAIFRVVDSKSNPNIISCLDGIRCMSLIWVVFGHEYGFALASPNINSIHMFYWAVEPFASFVLHGYFSVDSFFFIGGLLVAMVALRSMDKSKGKLNVPLMYLHRFIRIVPILAVAILVYMNLMTVITDGPLAYGDHLNKAACESGWFWTLLFVQNYATSDFCLGHSWYLAVDMQLYIISPLLLISLYKWGKKAAAGIVVLVLLLSSCLFATMMINNYSMLIKTGFNGEASRKLYMATHTHAAPWLIGFLFGYFLHLNRGKRFQLSQIAVWSGWVLSLAMIFTSIFAMYPAAKWRAPLPSILEESLYYTLTRLAWPLALCWIVFACMQGHGGLANSFLSSPLWQPLSRISYSVYIWHMFVEEANSRISRTNTYYSDYTVMQTFWSDFGFSLLMAYVLYIIIEAPLGGLDSLLRRREKTSVEPPAPSEPIQSSYDDPQDQLNDNEKGKKDDLEVKETTVTATVSEQLQI